MSFQSNFEHLSWPGLPAHRGCAILAILYQLERTQWWSPEELLAHQLRQLRPLVDHARQTVPFHRERLADLPASTWTDTSLEAWRDVPLLTRDDVQRHWAEVISNDVPGSHGDVTEIYTSGSTGKPIRSLRTQLFELFWAAFTVRDHVWHRRDLALKLAAIRESTKGRAPYPGGDVASSWGWASDAVFDTGPCVSLNVMTSASQQAEWLARERPDYLLTHPSVVDRLARYCAESGVELTGLRQVLTLSETLHPATRDVCRATWGVPVCDVYSTREAGYVALQCPESECYHVQSESALVELLDDDGEPCRPGEEGRVVVTSLHNFAMPLIRYDLGDRARAGPPCRCGRGLPVIERILGREQDMLVLPGGDTRWPLLSTEDIERLLSITPVRRYQLVQRATDRLELRLESDRRLDAATQARVRTWVREKFDARFEVEVTTTVNLEPDTTGKFADFVSALSRPGSD